MLSVEPGEDLKISIYPSVPVEADGFCSTLSPTANTSSPAWGISGVVKMNRDDLLIKYMDHHGSALITDKVFSVLGFGFIIVQTRGLTSCGLEGRWRKPLSSYIL